MQEINADEGGLGFLDLLDWWEQAKEVPASLVNKNEQRLVTRLRQRSIGDGLVKLFADTKLLQDWGALNDAKPEKMRALVGVHRDLLHDLRNYKVEQDIAKAEVDIAKLRMN